jgi:type I site-specific restriction endonuclease
MDKKSLTEADIRTKFITPALIGANGDKWDLMTQIREEAYFTKGRVIVRGKTVQRGEAKKADYLLFFKPNLPIAVIEAKDNSHSVGAGMQQALEYAEILDVPFAYSSNGDAFLEHDRTATGGVVTRKIPLDQFPRPDELWNRYCLAKGLTDQQIAVATQDYFGDGSQKSPRYYQLIAINRTVEAIARGENRILLVMATGTGKTYTAFQIIWRLWKAGTKKRILFLVDRNILADQTKTNDFKPFGKAMTKITNRTVDKAYEIYLCLYQAVTGTADAQNIYREFSPDFFDLVIVDECHRGSAADDAAWRQVLEYFSSATQIGLTATPKETRDVSNIDYFGEPIYIYSLRQGIADGFLAPYKVVRIGIDKDLDGWRPEDGQRDKYGQLIEDREYNDRDYDKFYFTIMDFRRATALFADPAFDGDPVQIYEPGPDDPPLPPDELPPDTTPPDGEVGDPPPPDSGPPFGEDGPAAPKCYVVNSVPVQVVMERVQYLDEEGKLITESLVDYTRKTVRKSYTSLEAFLKYWNEADRKQAILEELAGQGVFLEELAAEVGSDYDPFDLVCHIAFDRPPLTRRERANGVKKRDIFGKYETKARAVLEALLEKYADAGITSVESLEILKVDPLRAFGTPIEIVNLFGGKLGYLAAIRELEIALYQEAA